MGTEIQWDSGVPPYQQLASILRARIDSGELTGMLPSARTIAQEHGVAMNTARKALRLLAAEGIIRTSQGWGSRVIPPEERGKR